MLGTDKGSCSYQASALALSSSLKYIEKLKHRDNKNSADSRSPCLTGPCRQCRQWAPEPKGDCKQGHRQSPSPQLLPVGHRRAQYGRSCERSHRVSHLPDHAPNFSIFLPELNGSTGLEGTNPGAAATHRSQCDLQAAPDTRPPNPLGRPLTYWERAVNSAVSKTNTEVRSREPCLGHQLPLQPCLAPTLLKHKDRNIWEERKSLYPRGDGQTWGH